MNRLLLSLFLAAPLIPVSTTGMAQQQFDGRWSVRAIPEKGACRRAHDYTVVVENGVPRNAVSRRTTDRVGGGLESDGRVRVSLQRRGAQVDVTGALAGQSGSGYWTIAGRIDCSGRWTASKWR
ncbi:hypothetical protein AAII07_45760 [Microvirga sp. 0TCS3.31]